MSVYLNNKKVGATIAVQLGEEVDPTVPQHVKDIKEQDIANWNAKIDQSQLESYAYDKAKVDDDISQLQSDITEIQGKIPTTF